MSEEADRELLQEFTRRWNDEGVAGIEWALGSDIEWIDPPELPGGGIHVGRKDTMDFLREWEGTLGVVRLKFEQEEVLETNDGYLVISLAQGDGVSGAPIPPHHWFHLLRIENHVIVQAQLFLERAQAFEAAGLSE